MSGLAFAGDSMRPWLRSGDRLLVEGVERLEIGDVLVFRSHGEWTAHRLLGCEQYRSTPLTPATDQLLTTKGDWATTQETIARACVVGRVVGYVRHGRTRRWRPEGPPYKRVVARLSRGALLSEPRHPARRARRWLCLMLLALLASAAERLA